MKNNQNSDDSNDDDEPPPSKDEFSDQLKRKFGEISYNIYHPIFLDHNYLYGVHAQIQFTYQGTYGDKQNEETIKLLLELRRNIEIEEASKEFIEITEKEKMKELSNVKQVQIVGNDNSIDALIVPILDRIHSKRPQN